MKTTNFHKKALCRLQKSTVWEHIKKTVNYNASRSNEFCSLQTAFWSKTTKIEKKHSLDWKSIAVADLIEFWSEFNTLQCVAEQWILQSTDCFLSKNNQNHHNFHKKALCKLQKSTVERHVNKITNSNASRSNAFCSLHTIRMHISQFCWILKTWNQNHNQNFSMKNDQNHDGISKFRLQIQKNAHCEFKC